MRTPLWLACLAALFLALAPATARADDSPSWSWHTVNDKGEVTVNLFVFYRSTCPHCANAITYLDAMKKRRPFIQITYYEISNSANAELYRQMARSLDRQVGNVPAFFYCKHLDIGYFSDEQTGARIERNLVRWHEALTDYYKKKREKDQEEVAALLTLLLLTPTTTPQVEPPDLPPIEVPLEEETIAVPGLGAVAATDVSLPLLTVVLAACDSFNPCAFFVLLFLLSLMTHAHSRWRMLLVGGTFVSFSALVYFLFMAAWLNLFFVIGHLQAITVVAGLVAVAAALFNVKDFFWFKRGPSLSIPESARPHLYGRMNALVRASSVGTAILGTAALAALVNLYELLCTSGFPMVFTRVLTLRELPTSTHYLYLVLYNVIYVVPLALIVGAFAFTLGSRKLTEYEGRVLKLLSGVMMLALGVLLLAWPGMLSSVTGAVATLAAALAVTGLVVLLERLWRGAAPRQA